ncbi:MAG: outer membrane receptor protein involved in Fe transport [Cyclobacteriaceae bacterium]|jgi:outer membrane receptor protein involved in Fe transport
MLFGGKEWLFKEFFSNRLLGSVPLHNHKKERQKMNRLLPLACIIFSLSVHAQVTKVITGTVIENEGNIPVEFATVALMDPVSNKPISGATTTIDGTFSLRTEVEKFYVEVSFIGFEKQIIKDFENAGRKIDLGIIRLNVNQQQLAAIVIEGEKSSTEFRLDKRVFNVGSDLSSKGASALDVLTNVPSVNVNIEGQVSLRGSTGVQILINGKPSVLTSSDNGNALGSITADMIEKVEVITNPSAKYEAEGTSGIINIILKKEEKKGTNGSISLNTGAPHNHSVGLSLNHRAEKFNLFSQFGVGYRELPQYNEAINQNFLTDTIIHSAGTEYRNEFFYNVIVGADYYINDNNVITLSGNYTLELEDQPSKTNFQLVNEGVVLSEWERNESTEASNPKYQFDLQYKKDFADHKEHDLLVSAVGSYFAKDQSSDFTDNTLSGQSEKDALQKTATEFGERQYTFKVDYTQPFFDSFSLETGAQYLINDVGNDFMVQNLENTVWIVDQNQTNNFEFDQKVLGVYSTVAYEQDKWGVKVGLRVENTELQTLLTNTDEANDRNYTNFFPTFHSSFKLTPRISLQGGYSKRIYRPRLWDLNPFFNIRNNFSIRQGNPDLMPEFTDSFEVGTVYNADKISMNFAVYHRYTTGVIERISIFENNVSTSRPENIGTTNATGIEFNSKYDPVKWLTAMLDFNYNYFDRKGALEGNVIDFSANQWSTKLNTRFKLPADFDIEITGRYQSSYQTVQGSVSDMIFFDLGARKKILKGRGVIYSSVRDLFIGRVNESTVLQQDFYLYNQRYRGRFFVLGMSYGFGKGEAMTYTGGRR